MSTLSVSNITDGTDTVETGYVVNGSAKAYGYSDGSGSVLSTTLNVSSLTDVAAGKREFNLTSAMSNVASPTFGQNRGGNTHAPYTILHNTSTLRLWQYNISGANVDYEGGASAFGDLA